MQTFTFKPAGPLTTTILARKTTAATVEFKAEVDRHIFVHASLEADADGETWRATVQSVPIHNDRSRQEAILHVTKGELGKPLGSVELGTV
jgi:hypothetical protein